MLSELAWPESYWHGQKVTLVLAEGEDKPDPKEVARSHCGRNKNIVREVIFSLKYTISYQPLVEMLY